jgi:hypothetical protein
MRLILPVFHITACVSSGGPLISSVDALVFMSYDQIIGPLFGSGEVSVAKSYSLLLFDTGKPQEFVGGYQALANVFIRIEVYQIRCNIVV